MFAMLIETRVEHIVRCVSALFVFELLEAILGFVSPFLAVGALRLLRRIVGLLSFIVIVLLLLVLPLALLLPSGMFLSRKHCVASRFAASMNFAVVLLDNFDYQRFDT